ncbi:MAG: hypothetical protein HC853_07500 [Anaerolineae bacterium]|nr:hypothetical protein [Anaerolineae bacterium]
MHVRTAAAQTPPPRQTPPPWPAACQSSIVGGPVIPQLKSGSIYSWSFVANFNHAKSEVNIVGCLTEAEIGPLGNVVLFVSLVSCSIVNNVATPKALFGDGTAVFDGSAYIRCSLPLMAAHRPDNFWISTRTKLPLAGKTHTLLASGAAKYEARTDTVCSLTLRSTYTNTLNLQPTVFANAAGAAKCGVMFNSVTRIQPKKILHYVDGIEVTPIHTGTVRIGIPQVFEFQIGAVGEIFTLDEIVIDPRPLSCCSGG